MCQRWAPSAAGSVRGGAPSRSCVARPYRRPRPAFARAASRREPLRARTRRTVESGRLTRARQRTPHRAACAGPRPSPTTSRADARTGGDRFAARRENPKRQRRSPRTKKSRPYARALEKRRCSRGPEPPPPPRAPDPPADGRRSRALSKSWHPTTFGKPLNAAGRRSSLRRKLLSYNTTHRTTTRNFFFWRLPAKAKDRGSPWVDLPWTQHRHHRSGARRSDARATQLPAVEHHARASRNRRALPARMF